MSELALDVQNASKKFGGLVAVNDVSLQVRPREIFSIIGPNGAGKTTFFNLLTGIYKPDTGRVVFSAKTLPATHPIRWPALALAVPSRTSAYLRP